MAAEGNGNLLAAAIPAARARATLGEISTTLSLVFGEHSGQGGRCLVEPTSSSWPQFVQRYVPADTSLAAGTGLAMNAYSPTRVTSNVSGAASYRFLRQI